MGWAPQCRRMNRGQIQPAYVTCVHRDDMSKLTSADGPVITPAHVAVCHSEAADALGALQFVTLIAGIVHCSSSPAVRKSTENKLVKMLENQENICTDNKKKTCIFS